MRGWLFTLVRIPVALLLLRLRRPCAFTASTAEQMQRVAWQALHEGQHQCAALLGRLLRWARDPSGYEIEAFSLNYIGRRQDAIRLLEEGVARAPRAWLLWQLLGSLYSDEGRCSDADGAYGNALGCPEVDPHAVRYNMAVLLARQGRSDEALLLLRGQLASPGLRGRDRERTLRLHVRLLMHQKRYADVTELLQSELRQIGDPAAREGEDPAQTQERMGAAAWCHAGLGHAIWRERRDREATLQHVQQALRLRHGEPLALDLVRQLHGLRATRGRLYRMIVKAEVERAAAGAAGAYLAHYEVVADDPEEAMRLIRELEPEGRLDSYEEGEAPGDVLKGVYWCSGRIYFVPEGPCDHRVLVPCRA